MYDMLRYHKDLSVYIDETSESFNSKIHAAYKHNKNFIITSPISIAKKLFIDDTFFILEEVMNTNLLLLQENFEIKKFNLIKNDIDKITKHFTKSNNPKYVEVGNMVFDRLMQKIINENDNDIKIPISILYIKKVIVKDAANHFDFVKTIIWVVLKIVAVNYLLNEKKLVVKNM